MTNYEKIAGTIDRFADFIAGMDCERGAGGELTHLFCLGDCHDENEDANCTEEKLKKCIIKWLNKEAK